MKTKQPKSETLRIRVTPDVMGWLRRAAAKAHIDVSDIVRPVIMDMFEKRHAK
jgi:uncharacterized protein (DUF1778 family)